MIWAEHFNGIGTYSLNTAGNIFFSDGYADYLGILNGDGSSCFSGGCTDNEPAYVGSWPGFTKPYLVGEDLDAEGSSLPVIITWPSIDVSSCTSGITFAGIFGAYSGRFELSQSDGIVVKAALDGGSPVTILDFAATGSSSSLVEATLGLTLSTTAAPVSTLLTGTGSSLVLSIEITAGAGSEEIAIDELSISCAIPPPPVVTPASPPTPPTLPPPSSPPAPPTAPPPSPAAPILVTTITEINTNHTGGACHPSIYVGTVVQVTGVVTAVVSNGIVMQERAYGTPNGGMWVYIPSSSSSLMEGISVSMSVTVVGEVNEYYDLTQIRYVQSVTIASMGAILVPLVTTTGAIGDSCSASGEGYEGLLVTVENVQLIGPPTTYHEFPIDDGTGETQLEGLLDGNSGAATVLHLEQMLGVSDGNFTGKYLASVTGVVRYSFGSYEIHPRTAADIVLASPPPMPPLAAGAAYAAKVTFDTTLSYTTAEFDATKQESFKTNLAAMFAGVTPDMITLIITPVSGRRLLEKENSARRLQSSSGIIVTSEIQTTMSQTQAQASIVAIVSAATPASLATSLGLPAGTVTAVAAPVVANVVIYSPPPSPPVVAPPPPAGGSALVIVIVIAAVVIGITLCLICAYAYIQRKETFVTHQPASTGIPHAPKMGASLEMTSASPRSPRSPDKVAV